MENLGAQGTPEFYAPGAVKKFWGAGDPGILRRRAERSPQRGFVAEGEGAASVARRRSRSRKTSIYRRLELVAKAHCAAAALGTSVRGRNRKNTAMEAPTTGAKTGKTGGKRA